MGMSNDLVSISDFIDWVEERAFLYVNWANDVMYDLECGNTDRIVDSCTDAIVWLKRRNILKQVEARVDQLPRVGEDLIERSVLLDTLSASFNTNKDRLRWSIRRAEEYGRRGCYVDMLKECQDAMRHESARDVYQRLYSYVRYMPTAGTIEARLQKGVIIHEKH